MPLTKRELKEWTDFLRNNPEKQVTGVLKKDLGDGNYGYCCLGALCEIQGLESVFDRWGSLCFRFTQTEKEHTTWGLFKGVLRGDLALKLGDGAGIFEAMGMPDIQHEGAIYYSLTGANDAGVPWSIIADHLDKHYPAIDDVV